GQRSIVVAVSDQDVWGYRAILNCFTAGRVVFGNGQDQGGAVGNLNNLLNRAVAECLVANNVAASIFQNGCCYYFRRSRSAPVHKHDQRQVCDGLLRIGVECLTGILLSLEVGNGAVVQKKVGGGDAFGFFSKGSIT